MNTVMTALCATAMLGATAQAGVTVNVGVDDSSAPWLGFMNVFNLPADGGDFQFASGWGVGDLNASFDDGAGTVTMSPNTIGDPDPYWYIGGGGPGAAGNKIMEANMYQQADDTLAGVNVNFSGMVDSYTFSQAHVTTVFIRDFAADFSSFTESSMVIDSAGAFSIDLVTDAGAGRHVQWGIQVKGVNVWAGDESPFGNAVFATIPAPGSAALFGLGGLVASRRRRG